MKPEIDDDDLKERDNDDDQQNGIDEEDNEDDMKETDGDTDGGNSNNNAKATQTCKLIYRKRSEFLDHRHGFWYYNPYYHGWFYFKLSHCSNTKPWWFRYQWILNRNFRSNG